MCIRFLALVAMFLMFNAAVAAVEVRDARGKLLRLDRPAQQVLCSGPGCVRLLAYLGATQRLIAVDDLEKRPVEQALGRPYAMAHPELRELPLSGTFRGRESSESILALPRMPEVILRTLPHMGTDPHLIEARTGIPVLVLPTGDLLGDPQALFASLRMLGEVLGLQERAGVVVQAFGDWIRRLEAHFGPTAGQQRPSCYLGGVSFKGAQGLTSTAPSSFALQMGGCRNLAAPLASGDRVISQMTLGVEQLVAWDPHWVFVDMASRRSAQRPDIEILENPVLQQLRAVRQGRVRGLLPSNYYGTNYAIEIANAWAVGCELYPERCAGDAPGIEDFERELYGTLFGVPDLGARMRAGFADGSPLPLAGDSH